MLDRLRYAIEVVSIWGDEKFALLSLAALIYCKYKYVREKKKQIPFYSLFTSRPVDWVGTPITYSFPKPLWPLHNSGSTSTAITFCIKGLNDTHKQHSSHPLAIVRAFEKSYTLVQGLLLVRTPTVSTSLRLRAH